MSVETVNGVVFLPHIADWREPPVSGRHWLSQSAAAVTGAEDRAAMRTTPYHSLGWKVTPYDVEEQTRIEARVLEAKRSGNAAAPWWSRPLTVATAVTTNTLVVSSSPWLAKLAAGDWIVYLSSNGPGGPSWEAMEIATIVGTTITFTASITGASWPVGAEVRPVIFGRFSCDTEPAIDGNVGVWGFKITEPLGVGELPVSSIPATDPEEEGGATLSFVWGEPWTHDFTVAGGVYYYEDATSQIPAAYAQDTAGDLGIAYGPNYSGTPGENTRLGDTRVYVNAYPEDPAPFDQPPVGFTVIDTKAYFRAYYGDLAGSLPGDGTFTEADILALTHNGGQAGPATQLLETARNGFFRFGATTGAKYRLLVIPAYVHADGGFTPVSGRDMNRVRNPDHTEANVIDATGTPTPSAIYQGTFATSYNLLVINGVQHVVYVFDATTDAFDVYTRKEVTGTQTFTKAPTATNWSETFTVNQFDTALGSLISATLAMSIIWNGQARGENLDGVGRTITTNIGVNQVWQIPGPVTVTTLATSYSYVVSPAAFDGDEDHLGASGWEDVPRTRYDSDSVVYVSGDPSFTAFQGTGTIVVSISTSATISVTGGSALSVTQVPTSTANAALTVTFKYHAA